MISAIKAKSPPSSGAKQALPVVVIVEIGTDEHAWRPAAQQITVPPFTDIGPALSRPIVISVSKGFIQEPPILKFHRPVQFAKLVPELLWCKFEALGEGAEDPPQHQLSFTPSSRTAGVGNPLIDFGC